MKKICFIAQFPPPMHGLSKAVETLYNSNLNSEVDPYGEFEFEKVDITNNKNFAKNLLKISCSKADLFYFTISQTKGGNLRDLVIFKLLELQHKKCLIHLHGGYYRQLVDNDMAGWQRKANYKAIKKLSGVIVLSNSLKKIFEGMIAEDRIFVVENCVDDQYLLTDQEIEEKLKVLENEKVLHVLWLSNFIRSKGYPFVLEMAKAEKERVDAGGEKRFYFDFAGKFFEESEKEYFENYIRQNDLGEYVTYHGVVGGEKKRELLKKCSVFALPTRYPNEGQPISILEAMGDGMFIITTDHAGIPDIVEDGVNGIVMNDTVTGAGFYDLVYKLSNDIVKETALRNTRKVKYQFSEMEYLKNMEKVYIDITKNNRGGEHRLIGALQYMLTTAQKWRWQHDGFDGCNSYQKRRKESSEMCGILSWSSKAICNCR